MMVVATEIHTPCSRVAVTHHRTFHRVHQAAPLAERQVEPGVHPRTTEDVVEQIERHAPVTVYAIGPVAQHHMRLVGASVHLYLLSHERRQAGGLHLEVGNLRGGSGKVGSGFLEQPHEPVEADIAIGEKHHVLRHVEPTGEAQGVGGAKSPQPMGLPQDVVPQGMAFEYDVLELIVYQLGRRVVVALYLIGYHLCLFLYLGLGIDAMEDDIAEQVDGSGQMLAQDGGIIYRVFLVGEGVEVAAHPFQRVEHMPCPPAGSSLEGDMLAEMGKTLLIGCLVARTHIHAIAAEHHGRGIMTVDHPESIGQSIGIVVHAAKLLLVARNTK